MSKFSNIATPTIITILLVIIGWLLYTGENKEQNVAGKYIIESVTQVMEPDSSSSVYEIGLVTNKPFGGRYRRDKSIVYLDSTLAGQVQVGEKCYIIHSCPILMKVELNRK